MPWSGYFAPAQGAGIDLQEGHGDRDPEPGQALRIDTRKEISKIDLAQRKVEQRRGDQYFQGRKQYPAHLARARQV